MYPALVKESTNLCRFREERGRAVVKPTRTLYLPDSLAYRVLRVLLVFPACSPFAGMT